MLHIFISVAASLPSHLPISQSINEVRSVAMSNVNGVTPDHLLQQMYGNGTQVSDEYVDLDLSDEELESVRGLASNVNSEHSDVFYQGTKIIDYADFTAQRLNHHEQIDYICKRLPAPIDQSCCLDPQQTRCHESVNGRKPAGDRQIAAEISQQIRVLAPIAIKEQRGGLNVDLSIGKVTYRR